MDHARRSLTQAVLGLIPLLLMGCSDEPGEETAHPPTARVVAPSCDDGPLKPAVIELVGQVDGASPSAEAYFDLTGPAPTTATAALTGGGQASATADLRAQGAWTITLRVEDPAGQALSDAVDCTVANEAPTGSLTAPASGAAFTEEDAIVFEAQVADADDPMEALTVTFSSQKDGALGSVTPDETGRAVLTTPLSVFNHVVTMTVSDPWGGSSSATVTLSVSECHDNDGDGFTQCSLDCKDSDPTIHVGAEEVCDGRDDDCDGQVDELGDDDGDGAPECAPGCAPGGDCLFDCDDADPAIGPDAFEICDDAGLDEDCDGRIDEGFDADGDGVSTCDLPRDCDDADPRVAPGLTEICDSLDNDCDGQTDEGLATIWYRDYDGDGYGDPGAPLSVCDGDSAPGHVPDASDCDDRDASVHPGGEERCDGEDDDCDGALDEGLPQRTFYVDADGDAFGDSSLPLSACAQPGGAADVGEDCDDGDAGVHPRADEACDEVDQDCDGAVDERVQTPFYPDADGDGYGAAGQATPRCAPAEGEVSQGGDCEDRDPSIHPQAVEVCDGVDQDCDGRADDGVTQTYYEDVDGDGWGFLSTTAQACEPPPGYVDRPGDCAPADPTVNPAAVETCDGQDDDCDQSTDEGVKLTFYVDRDGDGYGRDGQFVQACSRPEGTAPRGGDCDDADATTYPDAPEACDASDNDCDGAIDEGLPSKTWYVDADGDGFGSPAQTAVACAAPDGFVVKSTDCDDADPTQHPGAAEVCDAADTDCDGRVDEGVTQTFYTDVDGDGYGLASAPIQACARCDTCATQPGDCDDRQSEVYPGAPERFDGLDNDCDGAVEAVVPLELADASFGGPDTGASAGYGLVGGFDLDGDGYGDLAFSAPYDDATNGAVYLFYGRPVGWGALPASTADAVFTGVEADTDVGLALAAGDLDRDGLDDLAIAAPRADGRGALTDAGRVSILYGGRLRSGTLKEVEDTFIQGNAAQMKLGSALAMGDVSCDGLPDLLIGAPLGVALQSPNPAGGLTVAILGKEAPYSGPGGIGAAEWISFYGDGGDVLGQEVAAVGDVDGDGCGDLLAVARGSTGFGPGASTGMGTAYLAPGGAYTPGAGVKIADVDLATWDGDAAGDRLGWRADGPGDVDGDGAPDLLLGRQASDPGEPLALVISGGEPLPASGLGSAAADTRIVSASGLTCPCVAAGVGDVNGDGIGDFAVGLPEEAGGRVHLFFGRPSGLPATLDVEGDADVTFIAPGASDLAGWAISPAGDVDGDGAQDFAVSAPGAVGVGGLGAGRVYLFFGY